MTLGSRLLKYQLFLSLKWRRLELWVLTQFSCPKCHGRFVEVSNDHLLLKNSYKIAYHWHQTDMAPCRYYIRNPNHVQL